MWQMEDKTFITKKVVFKGVALPTLMIIITGVIIAGHFHISIYKSQHVTRASRKLQTAN